MKFSYIALFTSTGKCLKLYCSQPGTASGIVFITLEDEKGIANLVDFSKLFDQCRKEILQSRLLMVEGKLQIEGDVIHVIVKKCSNVSGLLQKRTKTESEAPALLTLSRSDEKVTENYATQDKRVQRNMALEAEIFHGEGEILGKTIPRLFVDLLCNYCGIFIFKTQIIEDMPEFVSYQEILTEVNEFEGSEKLPAFSGRRYPIEYLDSREFERLAYFVYQHEIGQGIHAGLFDSVMLMKGTAERGRDCILRREGKNVGVIQCKRYASLVTVPDLCREVCKFVLHALQDDQLIEDDEFAYHFVALKGLNDKAVEYVKDFKGNVAKEPKLKIWVEQVLEENETLKHKDYESIKEPLMQLFEKISLKVITGDDLDKRLKNAKGVVAAFFEIEKVVSEDLLKQFGEQFLGFKSNEDLEQLRLRLKDTPDENKLKLGIFNLYGYDRNFYKKLSKKRQFFFQIADVKSEISKTFIEYLKETIEKYMTLFVSGLPHISPFTKQVVVPYLFNKYAKIHHIDESGQFMYDLARKDGVVNKYQTIEEHKEHLLEIGQKVLDDDYSSFYGDEDMINLKKAVARFIHASFKSTKEMSDQFDEDMKTLKPIIDTIENEIKKLMPQNATLIIENSSTMKTATDFAKMLKNASELK